MGNNELPWKQKLQKRTKEAENSRRKGYIIPWTVFGGSFPVSVSFGESDRKERKCQAKWSTAWT